MAAFIYPTTYHTISGDYPRYSSGKEHHGVDFPCPVGTEVYAVADGTVIHSGWGSGANESFGIYVQIRHNNATTSVVAHLSSVAVSVGTAVKQGQIVGYSGSTGNSSGPHVHLGVYVNGNHTNPHNYLPDGGGNSLEIENTLPAGFTKEYDVWTGHGFIKGDYSPILWFDNSGNISEKWQDAIGGSYKRYYGMSGEWMTFLGKIDDYYYGRIYGICQSCVKGLVAVSNVNNYNGRATGTKNTIQVGSQTVSSGSKSGTKNTIPEEVNGIRQGTTATYEFTLSTYTTGTYNGRPFAYGLKTVWEAWINGGKQTTKDCASIDGKIIIACTTTFGKDGDHITWEFDDGTLFDTIMGDTKRTNNAAEHSNAYGHDYGASVIEICGAGPTAQGDGNPFKSKALGYLSGKRVVAAYNHGQYIKT